MDSQYLNKNVSIALSEGISAMLVANPDDRIEYIANYLIQYVERRRRSGDRAANSARVDAALGNLLASIEDDNKANLEKRQEIAMKQAQYPAFLDSIRSTRTKQDALDSVSSFVSDYFNIPTCSIAFKKPAGESEVLNYYSANPAMASIVVGKKIQKVEGEGDDLPPRQGISFDAFKLPEPEPEEMDEEGNPIPKPPPQMQPLIVDNVMREKRIKFFGIPKLGSYVAVPFTYKSVDHDAAVQVNPPEEGQTEGTITMNKIDQSLIISIDSIGNFRRFSGDEIAKIKDIGSALVAVIEGLEAKTFNDHVAFLVAYKAVASTFGEEFTKIPDLEAAALAAVAQALTVDPAIDPPPEPAPESLKPHKESAAVLDIWNSAFKNPDVVKAITALDGHLLPLTQPCANLFYAVGALCGLPQYELRDVCGDITWGNIRAKILPRLPGLVADYSCTEIRSGVTKESSTGGIKAFVEGNNLADVGAYPSAFPILGPLSQWVGKALAAREAASVYHKEVLQQALETA